MINFTEMGKTNLSILFGEIEVKSFEYTENLETIKDNVYNFSFGSEKEKSAFLFGVQTALGWQDYIVLKNENNSNK